MQRCWSSTARLALSLLALSAWCTADNINFSTGSIGFSFDGVSTSALVSASGNNLSLSADLGDVVRYNQLDAGSSYSAAIGCTSLGPTSCDVFGATLRDNGVTYPYGSLFVDFESPIPFAPSGAVPFTNTIPGTVDLQGQFCTSLSMNNCIPFQFSTPAIAVVDFDACCTPPGLYIRDSMQVTFTPEPATFAMVFAGLGMCGVYRRRRGSSASGLFVRRISHFATS